MSRFRVFYFEHRASVIWGLIFALAVTLAFGAGYLIALQANTAPIIIEQCSR